MNLNVPGKRAGHRLQRRYRRSNRLVTRSGRCEGHDSRRNRERTDVIANYIKAKGCDGEVVLGRRPLNRY